MVVGRGLSVATGTVGAVLAIGLLWLMVPHSSRGGGGVAEVSSTVRAIGSGEGSGPRQTNLPLSIVSSSTVAGSSSQGNGTVGSGTTSRTFAPTTSPVSNVATSPIAETTSSSDPDDSAGGTPPTSASTPSTAGTNTTQGTISGGSSSTTGSNGTGNTTQTSTVTQPSGPTISGPAPTVVPGATTTSTPSSAPGGGSGDVAFAVALTDDHFVATTAAAVGGQDSLNVQLPTGNTVVGEVVSIDSASGIAVLSIPSDTPTTPIAPSTASPTNIGAVVMNPEPTPVTVVQDETGTQITTDADAHLGEGALVLDSAKHLIGLCTLGDDGVHVVGAQDLLDAINGAIANEPTATLGLDVNPEDLSVIDVTPGGPAEAATVQVGDIITAVDGTPVTTRDEIKAAVRSHHPGETATLTVIKVGTTDPIDLPVVLGSNPGL